MRPTQQRIAWAKLMSRVLDVDPLRCPQCDRAMRIVTFVTHSSTITRILRQRGMHTDIPTANPARAPPQLELPFLRDNARAERPCDAA